MTSSLLGTDPAWGTETIDLPSIVNVNVIMVPKLHVHVSAESGACLIRGGTL